MCAITSTGFVKAFNLSLRTLSGTVKKNWAALNGLPFYFQCLSLCYLANSAISFRICSMSALVLMMSFMLSTP